MLRIMPEGGLEVHGEESEGAVLNECMAEWQIVIGASHQTIRIPFGKVFKPHV